MTLQTLQYSDINNEKNNSDTGSFPPQPIVGSTKHSKTIKNPNSRGLADLYNKIHKKDKLDDISSYPSTENESNLGDFKPLPQPLRQEYQSSHPQQNYSQPQTQSSELQSQHQLSYEIPQYTQLNNTSDINMQEQIKNYNDTYYSSIPYSIQNQDKTNNNELLNKLNYIINLLEDQKDERTNYVIEELILYTFLGIFIIFIIDSFARASKYVR